MFNNFFSLFFLMQQPQKPLENNKNNKILIKNCFNNDNSVKVNHV